MASGSPGPNHVASSGAMWDGFPPRQSSPGQPALQPAGKGSKAFVVWKEEISKMDVLQPITYSNTLLI